MFREATGLVLAEDQLTVLENVKNAAAARRQCTFHGEFLLQGVRQTGGLREVVSHRAVFDFDFHGGPDL